MARKVSTTMAILPHSDVFSNPWWSRYTHMSRGGRYVALETPSVWIPIILYQTITTLSYKGHVKPIEYIFELSFREMFRLALSLV